MRIFYKACGRIAFLLHAFLFFSSLVGGVYASQERFLEYLYIDSNIGGAAGGHVALKLDEWVYHFQVHPDKTFQFSRDHYTEILDRYTYTENRNITLNKIHLDNPTYDAVKDSLDKLYTTQFKHLENLKDLRNDIKFLKQIMAPDSKITIDGAGFFQEYKLSQNNVETIKLKNLITEKFGENYLKKKKNEIHEILQTKEFHLESYKEIQLDRNKFFHLGDSLSYDYHWLVEKLYLIEIFEKEFGLDPLSYFQYFPENASGVPYHLEANEKEMLQKFYDSMGEEVIRLLSFDDDNWGFPIMVILARMHVVKKSIDEDTLYFLDTLEDNYEGITKLKDSKELIKYYKNEIVQEKLSILSPILEKLTEFESISESEYQILEESANVNHELLNAVLYQAPVRYTPKRLVPKKRKELDFIYPLPNRDELDASLKLAIANEAIYFKEFKRVYDYNLFKKNCVTELFDQINIALENDPKLVTEKLGGYINPKNHKLIFLPFFSQRLVRKKFKVTEREFDLSYRKKKLNEMYKGKGFWARTGIYFRESNVLTSTFYKRHSAGPVFLFFTDDAFWWRPVYGAVNLVVGAGAFIGGIFTSPFDKGELLVRGYRGVVYSFPELVFLNMRKGKFLFIPEKERVYLDSVNAKNKDLTSNN